MDETPPLSPPSNPLPHLQIERIPTQESIGFDWFQTASGSLGDAMRLFHSLGAP